MTMPRRQHSPEFKAKVALEAINRSQIRLDADTWTMVCFSMAVFPLFGRVAAWGVVTREETPPAPYFHTF